MKFDLAHDENSKTYNLYVFLIMMISTGLSEIWDFLGMKAENWKLFLILLVLNEFHHVLDQIS